MYATVPITIPGSVPPDTVGAIDTSPDASGGPVSLARPKSRIFTKPSGVTIRFSGFRSRCTIPAAWAFASPSATCAATERIFFVGSGPTASSSRRVEPSTRSMAMYETPPSLPIS
jgi:hypothetical protein